MEPRQRPYAGEADLQPLADLLNACEEVDRLGFGVSVPVLRHQLLQAPAPQFISLWEDDNGKLAGFANIQAIRPSPEGIEGWLAFSVHPAARPPRTEDPGKRIIEWGVARMREAGQEKGIRAMLVTQARDDETYRNSLLKESGFTVAGYMFMMARRLDELPEPQLPDGFKLRTPAGEAEAEKWVAMHNETFAESPRTARLTIEEYRRRLSAPFYEPGLDLLAVAPDGAFAAFCLCRRSMPEEKAQTGGKEGWVSLLGARREHRKLGLGRAMLLEGLRRLKAAGVETALLGVEADNPTGATRLYESVGFRKLHTWVQYALSLG